MFLYHQGLFQYLLSGFYRYKQIRASTRLKIHRGVQRQRECTIYFLQNVLENPCGFYVSNEYQNSWVIVIRIRNLSHSIVDILHLRQTLRLRFGIAIFSGIPGQSQLMKLGHQPLLTKKRLNCKTLLRIASVYCCNLSDHKKLLFEHSYNDPGTLVLV